MYVLWIAAGGAVGAVLRYGVSGWVSRIADTRGTAAFPWGTLAVNVLGCVAIGVIAPLLFERSVLRPEYRTAILIGLLGAFTTWSSFGYETVRMISDGELRYAALYVLGTNAGCLIGVWLAYGITQRWLSGPVS